MFPFLYDPRPFSHFQFDQHGLDQKLLQYKVIWVL
ncbi:uncharacterized protein METZ01_LOCUS263622 [marine metagenome]|uniref:Uncharacterized protein n=1 Tax=marine metagenome TaxID=408172 RepID=A0A382JGC3_9ZZZZ